MTHLHVESWLSSGLELKCGPLKFKIPNVFFKFWSVVDKFLLTVTHFGHARSTRRALMAHSVSSIFCDSYTQLAIFDIIKIPMVHSTSLDFADSYTL